MLSRPLPPITSILPWNMNYIIEPLIMIPESSVKTGPKKQKFSQEEDQLLTSLVQKYGTDDWIKVSEEMENRNPRQCRERWNNYVNPSLQNDQWTYEEDCLLVSKYAEYGSHWNKVSKFFPKRSDNAVRNRWHTLLRRSAKAMTSSDNVKNSD